MSDEFEVDGRSFKPGEDHLWTALDMPDGVNAALEMYSSDNVYTKGGKLINKVEEGSTVVSYFNQWLENPGWETRTMYYTAGMMQSWNKFCMQGGLIEVAAKLPGAINNVTDSEHKSITINPNALGYTIDSKTGKKTILSPISRILDRGYYPTWPGIWLMGNLGRALFTVSTTRVWPWTYNDCDAELEPFQLISACNATPGYGLNPNQGRGAPEIDILEGGGDAISSSIQIAPGMPDDYRRVPVVKGGPDTDPRTNYTNIYCVYGKGCSTPGANIPDAPWSAFKSRGHKNWYQGLRYAANNRCELVPTDIQNFDVVNQSQTYRDRITSNVYEMTQMSAARDVNADLSFIDGNTSLHWGINHNGAYYPIANGYIGAFLCDPDAKNPKCETPRKPGVADTHQMAKFEYQMDAISVNWAMGHEAYTTFYIYQVEWVMGPSGYIRWSLAGSPLFEIPAKALTSPPQGNKTRNPKKIMIEEPMYLIFNVALAKAWGAMPPNVDIGPCRGNATQPEPGSWAYNQSNNICDSFPMYMEIDYIRVYQNKSNMFVGCDPPTHPTKKWIEGHINWYTDDKNPVLPVHGRASCNVDDDCTQDNKMAPPTGRCVSRRCVCVKGYTGPRCTKQITDVEEFGPNLVYPSVLASVCFAALVLSCVARSHRMAKASTIATVSTKRHGEVRQFEDEDGIELSAPSATRRYYGPANPSSRA
ncbi:unnamed protein product [Aphanomyces euteiches]